MNKDIPICPKCNKPTRVTQNGGGTTLVYYQPIYEGGVNINPDRNTTTTGWECWKCGHKWNVKTCNGEILRENSKGK